MSSDDADEVELHEPTADAHAALTLEVWRPFLDDKGEGKASSREAWGLIRETSRSINQAVQRAIGEVVLHVRDLRASGKTRFATPTEKADEKLGIPRPVECYTDDDFDPILTKITDALRATGTTEYVWSSVARKLQRSEFAKSRLVDLLRGDRSYPIVRNTAIMMRARNWRLARETRIANGKKYEDVVIHLSAFRPHGPKMKIVCASLHGKKLHKSRELLKQLEALGLDTASDSGCSKGALILRPVRRPGRPEKWQVLIPYVAPRESTAGSTDVTVVFHRSVASMLTAVTSAGDFHQFPGRDIVALKHQMYARRRSIQQDLSANPHRGRGSRQHFRALVRLGDKERRATQTQLWRAARWAQNIVEAKGASRVILDDFGPFDPDQPGPPWEPYVRRFPFAELSQKILDALTRRAGVSVEERPSKYISQRCPRCSFISSGNVAKMPTIKGSDVEKGWFRCGKCEFETDIDKAASLNLLNHYGIKPPAARESAR